MNSKLNSLPDPIKLLSRNAEVTPTWLRRFKANAPFPRREFFSSRVVFYPAAGDDFHPLRLFGPSDAAHCFVMADYMLKEDTVRHFLEFPQLPGYSCVSIQSLPLEAVWKEQKWTRHFFPNDQELETIERTQSFSQGQSFALFAVYDGPNRLAVLYLGHEAVEVYDRLFCQVGSAKKPFAILIQNHGMGGDYNQMATPHSYLNQLANAFGRPKWIVAEDGNCVWFGYEPVSAISHGGMHGLPRRLFRDKFSKYITIKNNNITK
jgi:hypothetical protein